ncbi:hypothetical protein BD779DRAFT_1474711 [Infundibulicybe gibba]|nr:hypothetical protein BD779DRAFT_1474711 [Infundibulicybe gibba]
MESLVGGQWVVTSEWSEAQGGAIDARFPTSLLGIITLASCTTEAPISFAYREAVHTTDDMSTNDKHMDNEKRRLNSQPLPPLGGAGGGIHSLLQCPPHARKAKYNTCPQSLTGHPPSLIFHHMFATGTAATPTGVRGMFARYSHDRRGAGGHHGELRPKPEPSPGQPEAVATAQASMFASAMCDLLDLIVSLTPT